LSFGCTHIFRIRRTGPYMPTFDLSYYCWFIYCCSHRFVTCSVGVSPRKRQRLTIDFCAAVAWVVTQRRLHFCNIWMLLIKFFIPYTFAPYTNVYTVHDIGSLTGTSCYSCGILANSLLYPSFRVIVSCKI